jgi:hypothetical protein
VGQTLYGLHDEIRKCLAYLFRLFFSPLRFIIVSGAKIGGKHVDKIVFLNAAKGASLRTTQKIKRYGAKGWHIVMQKDSIACLHNQQAGTLVVSAGVPKNEYQPYRGWLPTAEIIITENKT